MDLSGFNTTSVTFMAVMFSGCESLTSLDISNFDLTQITNMALMFSGCKLLKMIEFPKSNSPNLLHIGSMFSNCESLISIDLSNLDTSKVTHMDSLFSNCKSLTFINLSNFDTSEVTWIESMFDGCTNLEYINLKNAKETTKENYNYNNIFRGIPKNAVICLNEEKVPKIIQLIKDENFCYYVSCFDDWHIYEEINSVKRCRYGLDISILCPNSELDTDRCNFCKYGYYPKESEQELYIKCYNNLYFEGYYLDDSDNNNKIFRKCYYRCKTCKIKGDNITHNCVECQSNYNLLLLNKNNYTNCYEKCEYYYYIDDLGYYHCTNDSFCPEEFSKLQINKSECIKNCSLDDMNNYEFQNKCYEKCPPETKIKEKYCDAVCNEDNPFEIIETQECVNFCEINLFLSEKCIFKYQEENKNISDEIKIKIQDKILHNTEIGFISENYDTTNLDNGKDEIIKNNKMTITLTTTENQNNQEKENITTISLDECESILRGIYNISSNKKIYMKKIDIIQDGMKIPKIEYDVYCKLNDTNLIKLNLSFCQNSKIGITIPLTITEDLDKLNQSSGYYNDICYTTTSNSGTDILLKDRKKEFIDENKTVCQDGCEFSEYNYKFQKVKCSCDIKEASNTTANMFIDKEKLFKRFIDIKNIANINILKCYKSLFFQKGLIYNIGSYIVISLIIFHFISIIIFYINQLTKIKEKIKNIISGIRNRKRKIKSKNINELHEDKNKDKSLKINKNNNNINNEMVNKKKFKNTKKGKNSLLDSNLNNLNIQANPFIKSKNINVNPPKKNKQKRNKFIMNNFINSNNNKNQKIPTTNKNNKSKTKLDKSPIKKIKEIMKYNEQEMNDLSYKYALKYDKRTYCEYYLSLLITQHNLLFSFYYNKDYNSKIIKINLFFISFIIDFTINALFFNDDTMHKIYEDKGKFQFLYQLPQIIYSSLISSALNIPLKLLALSDNNILELKKKKKKKHLNKQSKVLNKKLRLKFILYFLISSILLLLFWYYLAIFCAIYINTQKHLITDTLISFGLSLLYPFGIYLIPGIFRIPSLSNKNKDRKCLYKISKIFQMV